MGRVFKEFADLKDLAIEVVKASLLFLKVCRALLSVWGSFECVGLF